MTIRDRNNEYIQITINLTRRELLLLKKLAEQNNSGPYEYTRSIIKGWIEGQLRGEYRKIFGEMEIEEYANYFGDLDDEGNVEYVKSEAYRQKAKIVDKQIDEGRKER